MLPRIDHPSWFIPFIKTIINTPICPPSKSPIKYAFTNVAMLHNSKILKRHNYDIDNLISSYPGSDLSYGSEFRPTSILEPLLHKYHSWEQFQKYCTSGFNAEFNDLSDEQRLKDMQAALLCGNHKSAKDNVEVLKENIIKETRTGFQFPFSPDDIKKIKGAMVAPYGVASQ